MACMSLRDFKKHIRVLPEKQLRKELSHLYAQYPDVREYYDQLLDPDAEKRLLAKYKQIISDEFLPQRGLPKMRYAIATDAVRQFLKLRVSTQSIADLLLTYAESSVKCTKEYGDIDERFYMTMEKKIRRRVEVHEK